MSNDRLDKNFAGPWFEPEDIAAKPPRAPCMADVVAENARLRAERNELLEVLRAICEGEYWGIRAAEALIARIVGEP